MNPNNAHLVSQKKKCLKDSLPIFWVSHLPKSSPVFVNGSLEIQPNKMKQKTEKKNGAPFNSHNGCTEKRWRQSKFRRPSDGKKDQNLTFRAPKNQWKRWGVKWGPSTNLGFHGCHCGEISHPTYTGIISPHFFAGFWAHLVRKERKFCSSCDAFIRRFLFRSKVELLGVFWGFCQKTTKFTQIGWCTSHTCTVLCILAPKKRTVSQKNLTKRLLTPTTHKLAINWATLILSDTLCDLKY